MIRIKNVGTAEPDSTVTIIEKAVSGNATPEQFQEIQENVIRRKKEALWKN